ncbi:MBL fold metallo-hydrolase [Antrihabitans stalactiti]|uniref:MBL fold metallo-hydrolase n=1 Tax=Antrihabitans stalactiti TaxID=2584121 RepID=UPI00146ABCFD
MPAPLGEVQQVGERTWAYLQLPGTWFLNNAGIIGGPRPVLVDTCATDRRTRHLLDSAAGLVGSLTACISTHFHADHTFGHHLLPQGLPIWAAESARDDAAATGIQHYEGVFDQPEWGAQTLRLATDVVGNSPVKIGAVHAVRHRGVGHTAGDVVAWVPDDGVLFTGDLIFAGVAPLGFHASFAGWRTALEWLRTFDADVVVPGHGPVVAPASAIADVDEYLALIIDTAQVALDRGLALLDAADRLADNRFATWGNARERSVINLAIAIAELRGEPIALEDAIGPALEDAGGPFECEA